MTLFLSSGLSSPALPVAGKVRIIVQRQEEQEEGAPPPPRHGNAGTIREIGFRPLNFLRCSEHIFHRTDVCRFNELIYNLNYDLIIPPHDTNAAIFLC